MVPVGCSFQLPFREPLVLVVCAVEPENALKRETASALADIILSALEERDAHPYSVFP
jgi:hypothetical protein